DTPQKTKASVQKSNSSFGTTVTPPPTAAVGTRMFTSTRGKQPTTTSKAKKDLGLNVDREEGQDEEDEEDELYRDVNINLERGVQMADVHTT
nr:hypothetical protein [Tanacetum cinerariifolium]